MDNWITLLILTKSAWRMIVVFSLSAAVQTHTPTIKCGIQI